MSRALTCENNFSLFISMTSGAGQTHYQAGLTGSNTLVMAHFHSTIPLLSSLYSEKGNIRFYIYTETLYVLFTNQ